VIGAKETCKFFGHLYRLSPKLSAFFKKIAGKNNTAGWVIYPVH
jgi:hypothetical protein